MPFVPAPNVVEAHIRSTYLGQRVENILYWRFENVPSAGDMAALGAELADWWTTGPRAFMSQAMVLREIYLVDLTTQAGPSFTFAVANDPGGPDGSDPLPGNVALCVSFRTNGRGRSSRGRNYLSGWGQDTVSGNAFSTATAEGVRLDYETLITTIGPTTNSEWVVVSRTSEGQPRATALIQPVTAVVLTDINVDSQRRRLAGRGR